MAIAGPFMVVHPQQLAQRDGKTDEFSALPAAMPCRGAWRTLDDAAFLLVKTAGGRQSPKSVIQNCSLELRQPARLQ